MAQEPQIVSMKPLTDEPQVVTMKSLDAPTASPSPAPPGAIMRFLAPLGVPPKFSDIWNGPIYAAKHPIDSAHLLGGAMDNSAQEAIDSAYRLQHSPGLMNKASGAAQGAMLGIPVVGPGLVTASNQMNSGDIAGGLGNTTAAALQVLGLKAGLTPKTIAPNQTARIAKIVTDTVNPDPAIMDNFQRNVHATLPDVLSGVEHRVTGAESPRLALANEYSRSAQLAKDFYDTKLIDPIRNEPVGTATNSPTVGALENRLKVINATLKPTYEKGGGTAQAALTAENKVALTAEAAQIRSTLDQTVGRLMNIDPAEVGAARQKYGQMFDIADKIKVVLNEERSAANAQAKKVPDLHPTLAGVANSAIQKGWRWMNGNPADNALRDALQGQFFTPSSQPAPQLTPVAPMQGTGTPFPQPMDSRMAMPEGIPPEAAHAYLAQMTAARQARQTAKQPLWQRKP